MSKRTVFAYLGTLLAFLVLDGLWMQVGDPAAIAEAEAGLR